MVYNTNLADHIRHLTKVFQCLASNSLYLKPSKCLVGKDIIEYLDHLVTKMGVMADLSKVEAMVSCLYLNHLSSCEFSLG